MTDHLFLRSEWNFNPDEFYVHKPMLQAGKSAIIKKVLSEKAIKMVAIYIIKTICYVLTFLIGKRLFIKNWWKRHGH